MTYASTVLADSPALYWKLDESSGTTATDSSGNGYHGTYAGSPTLGVTGLVSGGGTSVTFDGVDDLASYVGAVTQISSAMSVEFWVKTAAAATGTPFNAQVTGGTVQMTAVKSGASFNVTVNPSGAGSLTINGIAITDSVTRHFIVAQDNVTDVVEVLVDGTLVASGTRSGGWSINDVFLAAASAASGFMAGTFGHFALYPSALSATQAAAHFAAGTAPASQNLSPAHIASTAQVFAPTIVGPTYLIPAHIASTAQVFAPAIVAGAQVDIAVTASLDAPAWSARVDPEPWGTAELDRPDWTTRIEAS